jgi:hypothetical protein
MTFNQPDLRLVKSGVSLILKYTCYQVLHSNTKEIFHFTVLFTRFDQVNLEHS